MSSNRNRLLALLGLLALTLLACEASEGDVPPLVLVDHGHHNYHRIDGTLQGATSLFEAEGFRVRALDGPVTLAALAEADVFLTGNPFPAPRDSMVQVEMWRWNPEVAKPAFTSQEAEALRAWVEDGGGLLVLADHAPHGVTLEPLADAFGVRLHNVETHDPSRAPADYQWGIWFTRADGSLGEHEITAGVDSVMTTLGQSLSGPPGSTSLLALSDQAVDRWWDFGEGTYRESGSQGASQGVAFEVGRGRVVFMGEAGWAAADADTTGASPDGWTYPRPGNRPFLKQAMHWLAGG